MKFSYYGSRCGMCQLCLLKSGNGRIALPHNFILGFNDRRIFEPYKTRRATFVKIQAQDPPPAPMRQSRAVHQKRERN